MTLLHCGFGGKGGGEVADLFVCLLLLFLFDLVRVCVCVCVCVCVRA